MLFYIRKVKVLCIIDKYCCYLMDNDYNFCIPAWHLALTLKYRTMKKNKIKYRTMKYFGVDVMCVMLWIIKSIYTFY